jgi:hypothetical protein
MGPPEPAAGARIGRYTVLRRVGSGARGVVYEARDEALERPVALKLLNESHERARREAEILARLVHPNIVAILDVVEYDGRVGLVQQWVDGPTLEQLLAEHGTLGVHETARLGVELCDALGHAHRIGILHRDLKPSNVLRAVDGFLLTDFGSFGELMTESATTMAGQIAGTPLWMSPEQIVGEPQSVASDIYGLGLVLFRCLYGDLPGGEASSYFDLMHRRATETIAVPDSPLQPLLRRCLDRDPARRPASVDEVRTGLSELLPPSEPDAGAIPIPHLPGQAQPPTAAEPALSTPRGVPAVVLWSAAVLAAAAALWLLAQVVGLAASLVAVGVLTGGLSLAAWLRRRGTADRAGTLHRASEVVLGEISRADLSRSLMLELNELTGRLKTLGSGVIGHTVVALAMEYEEADDAGTRIAALQQLLVLQERIQAQLTPWHVRHKELTALVISVVSCVASVASVVVGVLQG